MKKSILFCLLFVFSIVISVAFGALEKPSGFYGQVYGHDVEYPYCYALYYNLDVTIMVYVVSMKNSSVEEVTTILAEEQNSKPKLIHVGKEIIGKIEFKNNNKDWVYYVAKNKSDRYFVITVIYAPNSKKAYEKKIEEWILKQKWRSL